MGALRDIVDIYKDMVKNVEDEGIFRQKVHVKSLSKRASEGTVQFPVLISSSMDIETAQNITKALERNFATFVQIVFSMDPTLTPTDGKSAADYITKFHQNMDTHFGNGLDVAFDVVSDSATLIENDKYVILSGVYEGSTTKIVASNKEQLIDLMDHVRHDILNNKYVPKIETMYNFKNPEMNKKYNSMRYEPLTEAKGNKTTINNNDNRNINNSRTSSHTDNRHITTNNIVNNMRSDSKSGVVVPEFARNMMTDNDAKKANELVATTLHIRIKLLDKSGATATAIDFIVGVKAIMHLIRSDDMIENMVSACKNEDAVFNFLRWTTGEISFFKDLLLNITNTKDDVAKASKGASPWWLALKRRRALAKVTDANIFTKKRILPNASIVLTEDEVELIRSEYGYDLHKPLFVNKIMQTYFLLGFVIVDTSAQVAHFMFDGQTDFQSVTFSALEKANTSDERKFKEMLKVINRT